MPILKSYYSEDISTFLQDSAEVVLGRMSMNMSFDLDIATKNSWVQEVDILKDQLKGIVTQGKLFFEFSIPRLGKRIDVLLITGTVIYVLEFKTGDSEYSNLALDQAWDYALDLKAFHKTSHDKTICSILVITGNKSKKLKLPEKIHVDHDGVCKPFAIDSSMVGQAINVVRETFSNGKAIDIFKWENGSYEPTPTIIEAASALYKNHDVKDISTHSAEKINLTETTDAIENIIEYSKTNSRKAICFVTGVPGAGKTLVGLNIATKHRNLDDQFHSVFLSGNGPLVTVLQESLIRDCVSDSKKHGVRLTKTEAARPVKQFIQNVHHFRDAYILDDKNPPHDHVVIFDEAQRAWNLEQTSNFMRRKKGVPDFNQSEPDFLISCMDRHVDWAVVICLVGGGQEINTGEAGISAWIDAIYSNYPDWDSYISTHMTDSEYRAESAIKKLGSRNNSHVRDSLHLSVSMRSYRAEKVSSFVKSLLDINRESATALVSGFNDKYPIKVTRNLDSAKNWIRTTARANQRYGMIVSSQASRLKPLAIDIRVNVDPRHWFLGDKSDVRSSWYLEDVATEFVVQGLELDWACVVWDADFRMTESGWKHSSFVGEKWQNINKIERKAYLKNAYRVLLTRARQGMVIVVPEGSNDDPTRYPHFYDETFQYLESVGLEVI